MDLLPSNGGGVLQLDKAILLYAEQQRSATTQLHATIHSVDFQDGRATLMPGHLLTREALQQAVAGLAGAAGAKSFQFVDPRMVAVGTTAMAWFSTGCVRYMHFGDGYGLASGEASQPAMLWVAAKGMLYVFALDSDARPTPETRLYRAPHCNVYDDGRVCTGTAPLPARSDPTLWMDMFYHSRFTHLVGSGPWTQGVRGGPKAVWRARLKEKGKKPFPTEVLRPATVTVEALMEQLA